MKIRQCWISPNVISFKSRWFSLFNFIEYKDSNKPAVFFYNKYKDLNIILKHRTKCIVVITSSHTVKLEEAAKLLNKENIKILATAKISDILTRMNIKHEWPGCGIFVERVEPVKLGNMIYTYVPKQLDSYGWNIISKIKTKYKILIGDGNIPMNKWYAGECKKYYDKVFIGLNLSNYSGGQTSIIDLGLRGIPCITNVVKMPHTISWNKVEDIEQTIENESKNIGKINYKLAQKVYLSMDWQQKWLEID